MFPLLRRALVAAPVLVLGIAVPARAGALPFDATPVLPRQAGAIDLRGEAGVTIVGARALDSAGGAVAGPETSTATASTT